MHSPYYIGHLAHVICMGRPGGPSKILFVLHQGLSYITGRYIHLQLRSHSSLTTRLQRITNLCKLNDANVALFKESRI